MKLKPVPLLLLGVALIAVGFIFKFARIPATHSVLESSPNTNSNTGIMAKASKQNTDEIFKVVTDPQTGQYAAVNLEKEQVWLKDQAGTVIWTTNVVAALGTRPIVGERKINSMELIKNDLVVTVGKAFVCLDKQSGKITRLGSD